MKDNIFMQIISGKAKADIIFQDERITIFHDKFPKKKVHFLVVPNIYINQLSDINEKHENLLGYMLNKATKVAKDLKLKGYRVIINVGKDGGQEIPHLHMHILGGQNLGSMIE